MFNCRHGAYWEQSDDECDGACTRDERGFRPEAQQPQRDDRRACRLI